MTPAETQEKLQHLTLRIEQICSRPGMHVGTCDLTLVAHYLNGLVEGLEYRDPINSLGFAGFARWLEGTFLISDPSWHWTRILRHQFGNDGECFQQLPRLFKAYLDESKNIKDLSKWTEERLFKEKGTTTWAPDRQDFKVGPGRPMTGA